MQSVEVPKLPGVICVQAELNDCVQTVPILLKLNSERMLRDVPRTNADLNGSAMGRLVRTNKLSLLRVGIVARHGSLRSKLAFFGVGIVLKRFARTDKLPLFPVRIVLQRGSFGSVFVSLGVRIILRPLGRRRQTRKA